MLIANVVSLWSTLMNLHVFPISYINSHLVNVLTSKCMHRFDCQNTIEDNKQPHLSMNLK